MPKLPPIVKTNHVSLATALAYNPPNPGHNRFAGLEIKQNLGPKIKKPDFSYWSYSYCHFYNYEEEGITDSSDEELNTPTGYPSPSSLGKRKASFSPCDGPSTPLREASKQAPTPPALKNKNQRSNNLETTVWDVVKHQHPEFNSDLEESSNEFEGSSSDDYEETEGLFGAW